MEEIEQIRRTLIAIEENNEFIDMSNPDKLDQTVVRHVRSLIKERLLEGAGDVRMTDRGHKFLKAVRNQEDREKVREALRAADHDLATVALAVVVDTAIEMNQDDP